MRWRRVPRLSEPDSDSFKVKQRETDDEGDDDEGREQGKLSIQGDGESLQDESISPVLYPKINI